jgi:hypothetical protein
MLARSPRKLAVLSFLALVFIIVVFQQSPWAQINVIERMPSFDLGQTPANQELLPLESQDDAWGHALPIPVAKPIPTGAQPATKVLPPPMVSSHQPTPGPAPTKSYPPWVTAPSRTGSFIPPTPRPSNMKEYMEKMLRWARPTWDGHWPPFADYINKAYDPNRWENFDM